ncbi:MAG: hemerythrin domain-containing protein [Planctomycetes bacterium]|nr:hemerythrin domain-containing protein [Planctomycetota bacterium]
MTARDTVHRIESEDLEFGPLVEELGSLLREPGDVFPERLREVVRLLERDLPLHFDLEEKALFPILLRRIPKGPIDILRQDHATARSLLATIAGAVRTADPARVRYASGALVSLLRKHMEAEHRVLFPTAFRMLTPGDRRELERAVRWIEAVGVPQAPIAGEPQWGRLDLREIPAWERPAVLSRVFRALSVGSTLAVRTHGEPSLLRAPFELEWTGAFEWIARPSGEEWTVDIRKLADEPRTRESEVLPLATARCLCC